MGKDGKDYPLTQKQEAACQALLETDTQSDAFRASRDTGNMTDKQIHEEASKLFAKPKVRQRVKELQAQARERHEVTVDGLTADLRDLLRLAHSKGQTGAGVQAVATMGKLHGLMIDRHQDMTPLEEMTDAELEERIAQLDREIAEETAAQRMARGTKESPPASKLTH